MQSGPSNKYRQCADLLEAMLPRRNMYEQTVLRNYIVGLRSSDPIAWGRANAAQAPAIASVLGITI